MNILDKIVAKKREDLAKLPPLEWFIQENEECHYQPRSFHQSITSVRPGIIAEVKKGSPSKGIICQHFEPVKIAKNYQTAQVQAISVLTEEHFFFGSNQYLKDIRKEVDLPILRKDFTVDARQIYEARLLGADAILLIAAILSKEEIQDFLDLSAKLNLSALVEVHNEEELAKVLETNAQIIGINNRNLETFEEDLTTTERLIKLIPPHITVVSESAIKSADDIAYLTNLGAKAMLIGETLMRSSDSIEKILNLRGKI